jgi:hypothetical protein
MERNKLIYVLGLGPTLANYTPNGTPTIGVNDINQKLKNLNKQHIVNYVVVQDDPGSFDFDRYTNIINQPPKYRFFSQNSIYREIINCPFQQLRLIPYGLSIFDTPIDKFNRWEIPSSIDSTYLACIIASRLGYKNIVLHGADFTNHPELIKKINTILIQYELLAAKLKSLGINLYCSSNQSQLSKVLTVKYLT